MTSQYARKRQKSLLFLLTVLTLVGLSAPSYAKSTAPSAPPRVAADQNVMRANAIMQKIGQIESAGTLRKSDLAEAIKYYVEAGKLFEEAANTYRSLLPSGQARGQDVDMATRLAETCLTHAKELKDKYATAR